VVLKTNFAFVTDDCIHRLGAVEEPRPLLAIVDTGFEEIGGDGKAKEQTGSAVIAIETSRTTIQFFIRQSPFGNYVSHH
jgi:hypothetical protein